MKLKENKRTLQISKEIKKKQEQDFLFQYTQDYHFLKMQLWNELTRINKTGFKK